MTTRTGTIILQQQGSNKLLYINVSQNSTTMCDQYTPVASPFSLNVGDPVPSAISRISNTGSLPVGTTYAWESTYSSATPGQYQWRVIVTYPDTCIDVVSITVTVNAGVYPYTLGIYNNQTERGSVSGTPSGAYSGGTSISAIASANPGYTFNGWVDASGSMISYATHFTYIMPYAPASLRAVFQDTRPRFTFGITTPNTVMGSVSSDTANGSYLEGTSISIQATANAGYRFVGWYEGTLGFITANASHSFTMPANDMILTAVFAEVVVDNYLFSASSVNTSPGVPQTITGTANGIYPSGTAISVTAVTTEGYTFVGWRRNGAIVSSLATLSFTLTEDYVVEAVFNSPLKKYSTYVLDNAYERGHYEGTSGGYYMPGTSMTAIAVPHSGYKFDYWWDGVQTVSTDITFNFTMPNADYNLWAVFNPIITPPLTCAETYNPTGISQILYATEVPPLPENCFNTGGGDACIASVAWVQQYSTDVVPGDYTWYMVVNYTDGSSDTISVPVQIISMNNFFSVDVLNPITLQLNQSIPGTVDKTNFDVCGSYTRPGMPCDSTGMYINSAYFMTPAAIDTSVANTSAHSVTLQMKDNSLLSTFVTVIVEGTATPLATLYPPVVTGNVEACLWSTEDWSALTKEYIYINPLAGSVTYVETAGSTNTDQATQSNGITYTITYSDGSFVENVTVAIHVSGCTDSDTDEVVLNHLFLKRNDPIPAASSAFISYNVAHTVSIEWEDDLVREPSTEAIGLVDWEVRINYTDGSTATYLVPVTIREIAQVSSLFLVRNAEVPAASSVVTNLANLIPTPNIDWADSYDAYTAGTYTWNIEVSFDYGEYGTYVDSYSVLVKVGYSQINSPTGRDVYIYTNDPLPDANYHILSADIGVGIVSWKEVYDTSSPGIYTWYLVVTYTDFTYDEVPLTAYVEDRVSWAYILPQSYSMSLNYSHPLLTATSEVDFTIPYREPGDSNYADLGSFKSNILSLQDSHNILVSLNTRIYPVVDSVNRLWDMNLVSLRSNLMEDEFIINPYGIVIRGYYKDTTHSFTTSGFPITVDDTSSYTFTELDGVNDYYVVEFRFLVTAKKLKENAAIDLSLPMLARFTVNSFMYLGAVKLPYGREDNMPYRFQPGLY